MMRFDAARERAMQAASLTRGQVLADDPAGVFDGALPAVGKGIAAGATQISGLLYGAAGGAVWAYNHVLQWQDELARLAGLPDSFMAGQVSTDWLDRQRDTSLNAAQRYKPDPATTGLAGQVLFDLGRILTQVAGGAGVVVATGGAGAAALAGGAATAGAATTYGKFDELKKAGVDDKTALNVAAIEGLTTGAGVAVPAALGYNVMRQAGVTGAKSYIGANMAYGAAANIGMGVAQRGASYTLLEQNGYAQMAAHYEPLEASALVAEGALGAIFGAVGGWSGLPYRAQAVKDAALAATNARHAALDTAPGIPADPATAAAHSRALNEAIEQLLGDAPVNVADSGITDGQFVPRPREAASVDAVREYYGADAATRAQATALEPVVNLTGAEVSASITPANAMQIAREWINQNLRTTGITREGFGHISVTSKSWEKLRAGVRQYPEKVKLLPAIAPIIERGQYEGRLPLTKRRKDNLVAFHAFKATVGLDGKPVDVRVLVGERKDGKLLYNLYGGHEKAPASTYPNKLSGGFTGAGESAKGTLTQSIPDSADNVNIEIVKASESPAPGDTLHVDDAAPLTPQARADLAQRFEAAGQVKPRFDAALERIAQDTGATFQPAPIKGVDRAVQKVLNDYNGNASRIRDLVRATMVVNDAAQLAQVLQRVKRLMGGRIKRNGLLNDADASPEGYRDALIEVDFEGFPAELQISTPEMMAAKDKAHPLYVKKSALERKIESENREPTASEKAEIDALATQQHDFYMPAWEATKARNWDSERGAPLRENEADGNLRPPGTSQAMATQFGVRDTGISSTSANRVPSGNDSGNSITGITEPPDTSLPLTAARAGDDIETRAGLALLDEHPDLTVPVTLDDGQTVHVPLQEALRQADSEAAVLHPDTLAAAVQCGLARGA